MSDDEETGKLTPRNDGRPKNRRKAEIIQFREIVGETRGDNYDPKRIQRAAERVTGNERGTDKTAKVRGQGHGSRKVTAKEDRFAQLVAEGKTLSDAYREAYDVREGTQPKTIWNMGWKLSEKPVVAERINWHLERIEREKPHDDAATRRMVRDYLVGIVGDSKQRTSDRTRAAELLGKVGGVALFAEQKGNTSAKPRSKEELEQALEGLLASLRGETNAKTGT